ncbi:hypothetical protein BpHYR1_028049 [Brachionus plicatilis]|uniref:Uncharacterized protein n=1 Tax=Brachionus plicatilis TaxID=10195 RepID=A0A3M7SC42_BRAPC|nr:hypothetical protein BpHYR1_028049 [Brachionus plicatilis]
MYPIPKIMSKSTLFNFFLKKKFDQHEFFAISNSYCGGLDKVEVRNKVKIEINETQKMIKIKQFFSQKLLIRVLAKLRLDSLIFKHLFILMCMIKVYQTQHNRFEYVFHLWCLVSKLVVVLLDVVEKVVNLVVVFEINVVKESVSPPLNEKNKSSLQAISGDFIKTRVQHGSVVFTYGFMLNKYAA